MDCLATYFADNATVQPDDVAKYILENRSTVVKESIRTSTVPHLVVIGVVGGTSPSRVGVVGGTAP